MKEDTELAEMLEFAARLLRRGEAYRTAWRVADAGLLLRERLEAIPGMNNLSGLDSPTGRLATLPRKGGERHFQALQQIATADDTGKWTEFSVELQSIAQRAVSPRQPEDEE